ncbi:hypothetical protein DVK02_17220 [Halobellus sp. Atlit-31R]|nr:hypothetical protein DVK02_17220 [Halobellus sp. Atlit-31R]
MYGHGWTEAADIVFQYGDVLERFTSLVSAEQWLSQPARATPDRVWEESPGGEVMRELAPAISGNRIVLVDLPEESIEHEEEMLMAPAA